MPCHKAVAGHAVWGIPQGGAACRKQRGGVGRNASIAGAARRPGLCRRISGGGPRRPDHGPTGWPVRETGLGGGPEIANMELSPVGWGRPVVWCPPRLPLFLLRSFAAGAPWPAVFFVSFGCLSWGWNSAECGMRAGTSCRYRGGGSIARYADFSFLFSKFLI